jgi:hypothetical protein
METNLIYAPSGCPKKWAIRNTYSYTYAKICIFRTVSLLNGRRLSRLRHLPTNGMSGYTLGGGGVRIMGQWWVAAVARRRGAGKTAAPRKTIEVASAPSFYCKK